MGQLGVGVAMKLKDVRRPVPVGERVGVDFPRFFTARTDAGKTPYDEVAWELRTATDLAAMLSERGRPESARTLLKPVFEQFVEGFDTADLAAARSLLSTLG